MGGETIFEAYDANITEFKRNENSWIPARKKSKEEGLKVTSSQIENGSTSRNVEDVSDLRMSESKNWGCIKFFGSIWITVVCVIATLNMPMEDMSLIEFVYFILFISVGLAGAYNVCHMTNNPTQYVVSIKFNRGDHITVKYYDEGNANRLHGAIEEAMDSG
jgi:hypothetical protein